MDAGLRQYDNNKNPTKKMLKQLSPIAIGFAIAADVLILDQLTKYLVLSHLVLPPSGFMEVLPFFNLTLVYNKGISFGMLQGFDAKNMLIVFTLIISAVLSVWIYKNKCRFEATALGLILGGAVGNVIDRIRYGSVVDFLDFHINDLHWPAFNVADSAIVVGALLIVFKSLFVKAEK
jgi:signal peptidase II